MADAASGELAVRVLKLWDSTSQRLNQLVMELNDLKERLDSLERKYRYHRHQVGPGHWSGKAEV